MPIKFKVVLVGSSEQHEEILLLEEKDIKEGEKYEKFKEIKQGFYEGADGIVVLFDISQEENNENIVSRIRELRESSPNSSILLIGRDIKHRMNQIVEGYTKYLIEEGKVGESTSLNIDFFDVMGEDKVISEKFLEYLARKLLSRSDF